MVMVIFSLIINTYILHESRKKIKYSNYLFQNKKLGYKMITWNITVI